MLRIAIIEPVGAHGGNDIYDFNLINSLQMQDNTMATLYTCDVTKPTKKINVKLTYRNIFGKGNKLFRAFRYFYGTFISLKDAKKEKNDILHLHFFGFNRLEYFNLFMAKKIFGFIVVGTVHDVESFEKYAKNDTSIHNYEKFIELMDGIVVHTDYARKELLNNIGNALIDPTKIRTIYACDLDYMTLKNNHIKMQEAREKLNLPKNRNILLFFGQIKKVKGLDVLLKALSDVRKKDSEVLLVVAGKVWKDNFSAYEKIIQSYSLQNSVDLRIGFVSNDDVPYYFNAVNAIVLPYQKIYNSGVLIRAMSFATPVVASDFGPFEEFIENEENGFLFKIGDEASLANVLTKALENPDKLIRVGKMGKETIKQKFSLREIGQKYRAFYNEVLEKEV